MPREGPRAGRPPCSTRLGKGEPVASATTTTTPSTRSEEARRKAPSASPHRPCRAGRPTAVRDASSARRDPPPTRRGEARAAVGQGSGRRSGTAPPRGLERRTRRLPVVGAQRRKEGRRTQRGGELRHPQRQHRPNAPSRIAREGFLRRGGVAPETPRRAIPDGLPPTGGKGTTRNSGGSAVRVTARCASVRGQVRVRRARGGTRRPPVTAARPSAPARQDGGPALPPDEEKGKATTGLGGLIFKRPRPPRGDPADTTAPTTVAHAPATPWDYAGRVRARARGRPPWDSGPTPPPSTKLDRLDPPPEPSSGGNDHQTPRRRAGKASEESPVRPHGKAQRQGTGSDTTGSASGT